MSAAVTTPTAAKESIVKLAGIKKTFWRGKEPVKVPEKTPANRVPLLSGLVREAKFDSKLASGGKSCPAARSE